MGVLSSVLSLLDFFKTKIPIQDRKERWKNELDNLQKEREELLRGACNDKNVKRMEFIDNRIRYLNQLCKNSTNSS